MERKSPESLKKLLSRGRLGQLAAEARSRSETTERVRRLLPPEEAAHLVTASVGADGKMVLVMDSAAWAARVQFSRQALGARALVVKVSPRA